MKDTSTEDLLDLLDRQRAALRGGDAAAAARLASEAEAAALRLDQAPTVSVADLAAALEGARQVVRLAAAARRSAAPTEGYQPDGRPIPGALTHRKGKQL